MSGHGDRPGQPDKQQDRRARYEIHHAPSEQDQRGLSEIGLHRQQADDGQGLPDVSDGELA